MTNELYHYGVKGMKWGVHRARKITKDGSKRTARKYKKFAKAYDKYNSQKRKTVGQVRKINKLYNKLDKSIDKDVKTANKYGSKEIAKSLAAGRIYLATQVNNNFKMQLVSQVAADTHVKIGKDFTYDITANEKLGGVNVTVNGKSEFYSMYDNLLD